MKRTFFILLAAIFFFVPASSYSGGDTLPRPDDIRYPSLMYNPPRTERTVLDNKIILHTLENREIPLVHVTVVIRAGSVYEPDGREGLAEMTAVGLRTGGTSFMTGDSIDEILDHTASQISFSTNSESCTVDISAHKNEINEVIRIFSWMIRYPAFEEKKIASARNVKIESLRRIQDEPQKIAFREFKRLIYRDNPRGKVPTIESIAKITTGDLREFHRLHYFPENMIIAVTGDISGKEARELIIRHFGDWRASGEKRAVPDPRREGDGSIYYIRKEAPQSIILIGYIVPGKTNHDYYTLTVLDFILGSGGFASRITREIRNERGLSYSAGSNYSARGSYGVIDIYSLTKSSSTPEVISAMKEIIEDIGRKGVTSGELSWAKKSIDNSFIFSLDSAEKIAMQQLMMEFYGLSDDFLSTYRGNIERVSAEAVRKAAESYLSAGSAVILIVGNETDFGKPLSIFGKVRKVKEKI
ncbi:MAG: M16 family metallopeptidase [Syntrophales bacterium]